MTKRETYIASDGKEFDNGEDCRSYEIYLEGNTPDLYRLIEYSPLIDFARDEDGLASDCFIFHPRSAIDFKAVVWDVADRFHMSDDMEVDLMAAKKAMDRFKAGDVWFMFVTSPQSEIRFERKEDLVNAIEEALERIKCLK